MWSFWCTSSLWCVNLLVLCTVGASTQETQDKASNDQLLQFLMEGKLKEIIDDSLGALKDELQVIIDGKLEVLFEGKLSNLIEERLPNVVQVKLSEVIEEKLPNMLEENIRAHLSDKFSTLQNELSNIDSNFRNVINGIVGIKTKTGLIENEVSQISERDSWNHNETTNNLNEVKHNVSVQLGELVVKLTDAVENIQKRVNTTALLLIKPIEDIHSGVLSLKENADQLNTFHTITTESLQTIMNSTDFLEDYADEIKVFQINTTKKLQKLVNNTDLLDKKVDETKIVQTNTSESLKVMMNTLDSKASSSQITTIRDSLALFPKITDITEVHNTIALSATKTDLTNLQNMIALGPTKTDITSLQKAIASGAKSSQITSIQKSIALMATKTDLTSIQNSLATIETLPTKTQLSTINSSVNRILGIVKEHPGEFINVGSDNFLVVHQLKRTWHEARNHCQRKGGDLATPSDVTTLKAYLKREGVDNMDYWIGGNNLSTEGTWKWIDGSAIGDSWIWKANHPDSNGDCLDFQPRHLEGVLNDYTCTVPQRFICQR